MFHLWYNDNHVAANAKVSATMSHRKKVKNNPHKNIPSDVGNSIAQWNANALQGTPIDTKPPSLGNIMSYNNISKSWTPKSTTNININQTILMLVAVKDTTASVVFDTPGLFTFTSWEHTEKNNVSFDAGKWSFPESGLYRIMWGATYQYIFGTSVTADARITINDVTKTAPVCSTFSDRKTCSGTWIIPITVPTSGVIQCCQSSSGPIGNYVDSYWITIEKW